MRARALVRLWSIYGEPLWIIVNMGFPVLSSLAASLLYISIGAGSYVGFAVLGGVMVAFWGNVLWSMASAFNWDKQEGLFDIYLTSPASITALLIGMSLGGIINTVPSAIFVTAIGWLLFHPVVYASWPSVIVTFGLTLMSLYALGMTLSSLYLVYGREAETMNNVLQEPVSMLSGVYFPSIGQFSPFPFALQVVASLIPLTIGMDALRKSLFFGEGFGGVWLDLALLAGMAVAFLAISHLSMKALERKGRADGTISVRIR
jgi:ABC-2 type transport system permease protein